MSDGREKLAVFLRQVFWDNRGIKGLAFLITIGLFMAVRMQDKVQRWVDVDVEMVPPLASSGLVLNTPPIDVVRVHIKGRRSIVNAIRNEGSHLVKMDLAHVEEPGMSSFFFEPDMFGFDGVEVVNINPEAVTFRVEKLISRELPVRIKIAGQLRNGTRFQEEPDVDPSSVIVTGPSSVVRSLTELYTEEVGVAQLPPGEYEEEVPLQFIDGLDVSDERFVVSFSVVETIEQRILSGVAVSYRTPDGNRDIPVSLTPSEVALSLSGPYSLLEAVVPEEMAPYVQLQPEDMGKGGREMFEVQIDGVPTGVEVRKIVPDTIEVQFGK